ncbi:MAG: exodeoxyribonuclease VII large subunit [Bilophila wadsworthia]
MQETTPHPASRRRWTTKTGAVGPTCLCSSGAGLAQDLWAFNDERVAGAVYRSRIPVVAGIGHEVDTSIADMVADLRAATPSHAAQLLWPERQWYAQLVDDLEANLLEAAERRLSQADQRLDTLGRALAWLSPERGLARLEERFGTLARRLDFALEQKLERTDARLRFLEAGMSRYAESRVLDTRLEQTAALTRHLRQAQALQLEQIGDGWTRPLPGWKSALPGSSKGWSASWNATICGFADSTPKGRWSGLCLCFYGGRPFRPQHSEMCSPAHLTVKIRDGEADTRVTAVRATGESHDIP